MQYYAPSHNLLYLASLKILTSIQCISYYTLNKGLKCNHTFLKPKTLRNKESTLFTLFIMPMLVIWVLSTYNVHMLSIHEFHPFFSKEAHQPHLCESATQLWAQWSPILCQNDKWLTLTLRVSKVQWQKKLVQTVTTLWVIFITAISP